MLDACPSLLLQGSPGAAGASIGRNRHIVSIASQEDFKKLIAYSSAANGGYILIGLGMLDIEGEKGRLGGGIYDMPATVFNEAMIALEAAGKN